MIEQVLLLALSIGVLGSEQPGEALFLRESLHNCLIEINQAAEKINGQRFGSLEIEFSAMVDIGHSGSKGLYLDFKGDSGYLLLTSNRHIIDYKTAGDYGPSEEWNNHHLAFQNGSLGYFENECFIPFQYHRPNDSPRPSLGSLLEVRSNNNPYSCNPIGYSSIRNFIHNKYGIWMNTTSSGKLANLSSTVNSDGYLGYDESVFIKNGYGEGNCGIVSMSNILSYYSHYGGKNLLPSYNAYTSVTPWDYYNVYLAATGSGYNPKSSSVSLHTIYAKTRHYAISAGYTYNGMNDTQTDYAFCQTASYYGYSATYVPQTSFTQTDIIGQISAGNPLQLRTGGDACYGGHGLMITGYREYTGSIAEMGYTFDVNVFCVSVYDGGTSSERWYDVESLSSATSLESAPRASSVTIAKCSLS